MEEIWLKHYPSYVPHLIPPLDCSLIQEFEKACEMFKYQIAFISFGKEISYKELKEKSFHLAAYLQSQGLKKGDKLIIQLPNLLQYPISFWAAVLSGLTVVNMNPLYTAREMSLPIKETGAKGIIMLYNNYEKLKTFLPQTRLKSVIVTAPGDLLDFPKKNIVNLVFKYKFKSFFVPLKNTVWFKEALYLGGKSSFNIQERDFDDSVLIQYTGGTTGISKGAVLSQKNLLSNIKQCDFWASEDLIRGKEKALAPLPLYHIFAFTVNGLVFFFMGFSNLLIANPKDISSLVKDLKSHPISIGTGVNTLFKALLAHPKFKTIDFKPWKVFVAGGMPVSSEVQKNWEHVTSSFLVEGYGLTEASPIVCCNRLDETNRDTAGFPFPSTKVRIVDDKGMQLGIGKEGELEVKGPQVMKGYYQHVEETKKVLSSDGWLKTGDIAIINEKGCVQIKDRKKDLINISGLKVYPNEVEEVLLLYPNIKEAAVVAKTNKQGKEVVKAIVVQSLSDKPVTFEELKSHCKKHLASYKIPKQIVFVRQIPKNIIGKPLRRLLRGE